MQEAKDTLAEIDPIGVLVKDLEHGLLDFPSVMDWKPVLLCCKLGDPARLPIGIRSRRDFPGRNLWIAVRQDGAVELKRETDRGLWIESRIFHWATDRKKCFAHGILSEEVTLR